MDEFLIDTSYELIDDFKSLELDVSTVTFDDTVDTYIKECGKIDHSEYSRCCDEDMVIDEVKTELMCRSCGSIKPYFDKIESLAELSHCAITVSGNYSFMYKGIIYQSATGNYRNFRRKAIYDKLIKKRYLSEIKFDEQILSSARDLCIRILETSTYRHDVLLELLTACLRKANQDAGFYYKDATYAQYMDLKSSAFPHGDRIMREWAQLNQVNVNLDINLVQKLISFYFTQTKFDKKYMPFVYTLIMACLELHIADTSVMITKCVGSIYIIGIIKGMPYSIDEFETRTTTKRATFQRFHSEVYKHMRLLKKIFTTYGLNP